ncbi:MAG: DNA recombination protein RmuC [Bacteroidetes bacterium]|nr:MAG: DNA recombination protein RmuC [Bacteroidota bacterium]
MATTLATITKSNAEALAAINRTIADKADIQLTKLDDNQKANREELNKGLKDFALEQRGKLEELKNEQKDLTTKTVEQLEKTTTMIHGRLTQLGEQAKNDNTLIRDALVKAFRDFGDTFDKKVNEFNDLQRTKFAEMEKKQNELIANTEKRLEEMRATVDEKLTKTLSDRIGESFETVGKQLIEVQKGLGEMQTIAIDVGGLKKVLSNVKLRGGVGEVQLAMILEQILAPGQYEANVRTKAGSNDPVEFAIKLPGRSDDENNFVYLPIDAKFPKDTYELVIAAYENAIPEDIEIATKNLEITIKKMAKDISEKYLDPPNTTDFAIMFLPFEGIYAEVIRRSDLVDQLRDQYRITVAGPTTLVALLNSLQMGFRTLALQKRSSEVWQVLGAVKTEFDKFGGLLEKAQRNIHSASDTVDELLGKRSRAITRKLKNIDALPAAEAKRLLPEIGLDIADDETEG